MESARKMKLLVVEDDFVVRQGIVCSLEWDTYGLSICGQARNGEEGLKLVEECCPDIIITDIRMPRMDGLEFSEKIRQAYPNMEILIISGYDDFAYAKQAIRIGVYDYLLKPVDADELLKCVCRMKEELLQKEASRKLREEKEHILQENQRKIQENLLNEVVHPSFPEKQEKVLFELGVLGVTLPGPRYKILLLSVEDFLFLTKHDEAEKPQELVEKIREMVYHTFFKGIKVECFLNRNFQFVVIMNYKQVSRLYEEESCRSLRQRILEELGFLCTFSCGSEKSTCAELYLSYQEAVSALRGHICREGSGILYFEENMMKREGVFLEVKEEENLLIDSLQRHDADGMREGMEAVFRKALENKEDFERVKGTCIRLGIILISNLEEMSVSLENGFSTLPEIMEKLQQYHTLEGLKRGMEWLVEQAASALANDGDEKYSMIIRYTVQYVEEHYQQEISVKRIAEELYITPNYFSQIFKAQSGVKFIDYLNEFRIRKAKKYLEDLKLKIYQVAELSGYSNYKYFNKVFRKYTGLSPKEYRNQIEKK